jgi:hypothetical protein
MWVAVYYNLHARRSGDLSAQWTVAAAKSARTKGNKLRGEQSLCLADCSFVVQEGARLKVIAERVKSVHSWVRGIPAQFVPAHLEPVPITYNPYLSGEYRRRDNGAAVSHAAYVRFCSDGRAIAYGVR